MNSVAVGSLGSMVYLGATAGCVLAIPLLDLLPTRWALIICYVVQMIALYVFTWSADWYDLAAGRFFSGACQVILAIFLPVWVDAFSPQDNKTTWMTLIIMASPMGMLIGYGLAAIVVTLSERWWLTFYYVISVMIPLTLCLAFIPKKYLDIKEHLKLREQREEQESG